MSAEPRTKSPHQIFQKRSCYDLNKSSRSIPDNVFHVSILKRSNCHLFSFFSSQSRFAFWLSKLQSYQGRTQMALWHQALPPKCRHQARCRPRHLPLVLCRPRLLPLVPECQLCRPQLAPCRPRRPRLVLCLLNLPQIQTCLQDQSHRDHRQETITNLNHQDHHLKKTTRHRHPRRTTSLNLHQKKTTRRHHHPRRTTSPNLPVLHPRTRRLGDETADDCDWIGEESSSTHLFWSGCYKCHLQSSLYHCFQCTIY